MLELIGQGRRIPSWARDLARELSAFGVVGAVAFFVELASFNVLAFGPPGDGPLHGSALAASALATLLAMLIGWFGNRYWTYRDRRQPVDVREVSWFVGVNLLGLVITAAPVYLLHQVVDSPSALGDNAVRLCGWAVATGLRFMVYRSVVFRGQEASAAVLDSSDSSDSSEQRSQQGSRQGSWKPSDWTAPWRSDDRWPWYLALLALVCGFVVATVFHPGYVTADSIDQLHQAQGLLPITDWHPPVMAELWRILIHTTGSLAAMADLQVTALWAALWVLAVAVWKRTGNRALSLLMLGMGLAPDILTFTGVVWKDVHLAYALLAVTAIALYARELRGEQKWTRRTLLALGLILLAYAILVRKNAAPAVVPMLPLLVLAIWPKPGRRRWLISIGALLAVTALGSVTVNAVTHPLSVREYAQIPLDDVVHVLTPAQVGTAATAAGATPEFRDALVTTTENCAKKQIVWDAYFNCYPQPAEVRSGKVDPSFTADQASVLLKMWIQQIPAHAKGYAEYRTETFTRLMFDGNLRYVDGNLQNTQPELKTNPVLANTLVTYERSFATDLPWLFQAWFWTLGALILTFRRWTSSPWSRELRLLGLSSLLYVLCYIPTAPASNFRYVYWPAVVGTLAAVLIVTDVMARRRKAAEAAAQAAASEAAALTE